MCGFLEKDFDIVAPVSGKVIDLSEVPDEIFAQKIAGDGVAIKPSGDIIVAPVEGTIYLIMESNHAFAITLDNEIELLVHIGIDTVQLDGKGFERLIEPGAKVKVGTPIMKIDTEAINEAGYSLITPVLIANPDMLKAIDYTTDIEVNAGETKVISYKIK
ncbi:PTS glucose transporter subunit IIA [Clostridium sp. DJ247]|uniref:PTS sugar transporter subunit IIA n=1 Tax=Clostridium sp. DJ247 TaxID=2726188 RepID=UPI0016245666|nr:PTS glucose transporter subunit IIA [Clostridium sp. DJ247]MBC2580226.1 PTS glucose transporter subunit IIA [Clostridium sp. DJ247]